MDPKLPKWSAYLNSLRDKNTSQPAQQPTRPENVDPAPLDTDYAADDEVLKQPEPASVRPAPEPEETADNGIALGGWNYYFIAKLLLFWMGLIGFHSLENLAFAGLILLSSRLHAWRAAKLTVLGLLAVALLYHDSWLPDPSRVVSQASLLSSFSFDYFVELAGRFINLSVLAALLLAWAAYWLASRRLRIGVLIIVGLLGLGIAQHLPASDMKSTAPMPDMNKVVKDFFAKEALRSVALTPPPASATPFDIIFIHVCSLSWDDVLAVGLEHHPLWKHFDILLTKFNSATAYSGPSAIHLLRATCGQQPHRSMYAPAPEKCYLMNSLLRSGFEPSLALNHDGKFDDFLGQLQMYGRLSAPPLSLDGIKVTQHAFDGSPIHDDLSVLDRWLDNRQQSNARRVALYYNTISLHDGNRIVGESGGSSMKTYRERLSRLLDNMLSFMNELEHSGRRAVVVMVPEHGAAVRGDKRQIAGLREIPTPAITLVPVGIRVVGGNLQHADEPLSIDKHTSYLAIAQIVENMLKKSPFDEHPFEAADYVANLPTTRYVAQNENATVAEYKGRYYLKQGNSSWGRE